MNREQNMVFPWRKMNDFLLKVGSVHESRDFCVELLREFQKLIPFQQGRAIFLNANGEIEDAALLGVDKWWWDAYQNYYCDLLERKYFPREERSRVIGYTTAGICEWISASDDNEFVTDYIRPQKLTYCLGFDLRDLDNRVKCVFSLDRTSETAYSSCELELFHAVKPHLNNLFANMYAAACSREKPADTLLTAREREIGRLLCDGMTPAHIAANLTLSPSTVYRHIANIHKKLHVSNRQELMLKLLKEI